MQKKRALLIAIILLSTAPMAGAIPELFTVQGKLTDASSNALNGNYIFDFILYDSNAAGKNLLWSETRTLNVSSGIFYAVIGDANTQTFLSTLDFNGAKWIGVFVNGEAQLPLLRFTASSSAFTARKAMSIDLNAFQNFPDFNKWYHSVFDLNNHYYQKYDVNTHFVPYIGATTDVNLNYKDLNARIIIVRDLNVTRDLNVVGKIRSLDLNLNFYGKNDINAQFVPYIAATKDANLGAYNLTAKDLNAWGIVAGTKYKSRDANSVFGTTAVALGYRTTAFGNYSTAMGWGTIASEIDSTAMGYYTIASGIYSTAMGHYTTASNTSSTAMGYYTIASGVYSTAMGYYSKAAGQGSLAVGYGASNKGPFAIGDGAFAAGYSDVNMVAGSTAAHYGAIALGYNTKSLAEAAVALGKDLSNYYPNSVLVQDLNVQNDANIMSSLAVGKGIWMQGGLSDGDMNIAGNINIQTGGLAGRAICWKTKSALGYCSSVVAADGSCTCN